LLEVPVCTDAERGLLGLELDPEFDENQTFYLFYTRQMNECTVTGGSELEAPPKPVYNRVSSFRFDEEGIDPASEQVIVDELPGHQSSHNSGGMAFAPDGTLLVSVGEGKILGLDPDRPGEGSSSNPYFDPSDPTAVRSLVYASGLRNPFRFAVDPTSGRIAAADVGTDEYEEVNLITAGADYGYPDVEGPTSDNGSVEPSLWYRHGEECSSIIGGSWVPPDWLPGTDESGFAFSDFTCGGVFVVYFDDEGASRLAVVASKLGHSVSNIVLGPDSALYAVGIGPGPFPIMRVARTSQ
jgi:hypothetical protein